MNFFLSGAISRKTVKNLLENDRESCGENYQRIRPEPLHTPTHPDSQYHFSAATETTQMSQGFDPTLPSIKRELNEITSTYESNIT